MNMANDDEKQELRLLYEVSVKDLEFFKRQQWLVSYYAVLIYGTLFALARVTTLGELVFCLAVGGVALLSSVLLLILEHSIGVRRDRLEAVRENFTQKFKDAWKAGKKLGECHLVVALMLFTLLGGSVSTILGIIFPVIAT